MIQTSNFTFQGDFCNLQIYANDPVRSQIYKYTLEIQQMCPKYSLYLIWTNLSNVNNFWSRLPISLSKVTLGIYTSMPIILWGIKYTKMLLKYNNCTLNTVCIWFLPMFQILIQTSVFHFPWWLLEIKANLFGTFSGLFKYHLERPEKVTTMKNTDTYLIFVTGTTCGAGVKIFSLVSTKILN